MFYLNSFKPICYFRRGREAVKRFSLPPFIDASCRREPDFESSFPSISALCRGRMFAPRLGEGDSVVYMTVKSSYEPEPKRHWRLVAILNVKYRFESHREAADWYLAQGLSLPSNCMVEGNNHVPYEMTGGAPPKISECETDSERIVRKWDLGYRQRARSWGVFLACEAEFLELSQPPKLTDEMLLGIFGRFPPTLAPPAIEEGQFWSLKELAKLQANG